MAVSAKKRASDAAHIAKLDRMLISPYKEEGAKIRQAAADAGQSLQGYCLEAIRQRMAEDSTSGTTVCKICTESVEPWAKAAGQSVCEYVAQAVQERMEREKQK